MSQGQSASLRLSNKTVFITGASSGIGRATAVEFCDATAGQIKLILAARRLDKLVELKAELVDKFPQVQVHVAPLDVSSPSAIGPFLGALPVEFKDIDILVNNAGKALGNAQVGSIAQQDIDECFNTNVMGLISITQAVLNIFKAKNSGDIVQLGSIAGRDPYPGGSIYCATKFAVRAFTEAMRKELINTNIRVIEIQPGAVETEFSIVRNYGDKSKADAIYKGREPLIAEDIAEMIVFATSRRQNTVVAEMLVFPSDQASASNVYRRV